jgi:hypothetical protein
MSYTIEEIRKAHSTLADTLHPLFSAIPKDNAAIKALFEDFEQTYGTKANLIIEEVMTRFGPIRAYHVDLPEYPHSLLYPANYKKKKAA